MTAGKFEITVELRPCSVDGRRALFHKWITGRTHTFALVETETGCVKLVPPEEIHFCDNKINQYVFEREMDDKEEGQK